LTGNPHVENETVGSIFPDNDKFTILSAERMTSFKFDKIFESEEESTPYV